MPVSRDLFSDGSIAHISLKGQTKANRFATGTQLRVATPITDLRLNPDAAGPDRQVLYGHPVCQLEAIQGLARDETSGYVGYIAPANLKPWAEPTHRVQTRTTLLFSEPNFKAAHPIALSCGALLQIQSREGRYARTLDGQYAIADHLLNAQTPQPDLASTAEKLLGTPYLWGGNSSFGIDCSGLIQLACQAAHIPCPGDSDQQMRTLGHDLPEGTPPKRNDLMFWKGHVALVFDANTLIHANAHHMCVDFEPITSALKRIATCDGPLSAHKRL